MSKTWMQGDGHYSSKWKHYDRKYIGNDNGIGIAVAYMMKNGKKETWHAMKMIISVHQEH